MKKLLSLLKGKYLLMSILTPILIVGEVIMETNIPRIMSELVDEGITNHDITYVVRADCL